MSRALHAFIITTIAALLAATALVPGQALAEEDLISFSDPVAWMEEMERFFEENPELKTTRGSGWKPYNRVKWFNEKRRLADGSLPSPDLRWRAWEYKNRVAEELGAREKATASWFSIGASNYAGRFLDIEFDETNTDIIYAGSASGGLWKSTDNGLTWAPKTDELPTLGVGAVCVLPWDPDVVLIGTGEGTAPVVSAYGFGIFKSTDAGDTWSQTGLTFPGDSPNFGFNVIEANPTTQTILAGSRDGLFRSTDDGDTWTQIRTGRFYDIKWKTNDPQVVFASKGYSGLIKVSYDDGLNWKNAGGPTQPAAPLNGKTKLAVTPDEPEWIYAHYVHSGTHASNGIYLSTNAGSTWTQQNAGLGGSQGWYNLALAADPDNADNLLTGLQPMYRSTNQGVSYVVESGLHVDHHDLAYEPGKNNTVWAACDGGIYRSTNDGNSWSYRSEGLVTWQFYDICVAQDDADFLMGGTQDNGTNGRSGFDTWFLSLGADGMVCNIDPTNSNRIWAEIQFGDHRRSFNGGGIWTSINNGITGAGDWVTPVEQNQNEPDWLFTSTSNGIFRTTDGGNFWSNVHGVEVTWLSTSLTDTFTTWAVAAGSVLYTTDNGNSWTTANDYGFAHDIPTKIHVHPTDPATAFVTFGGYGGGAKVAMTTDWGVTWSDVSGNLPPIPHNTFIADPTDPDSWFVGTDVGVWRTHDGGASWAPFDLGLPNAIVLDLEIRRATRKLVAGTHGRAAWEIDLPGLIATNIGSPDGAVGSIHLMLDPPRPNPVTTGALFRFAARKEAPVSLDVFDVRGRLVDHVTTLSTGDGVIRTATWDASSVPSGVYFVRLQAGDERKSRRIVVTK